LRRAVKDGAGNVLQRIDYYPFGSVSSGWSSGTTPAQPTIRYRFSGKEIAGQVVGASAPAGTPAAAVGNPYLDFGARLYDPRTASWLSHDPLAEKYYGISSFAYCAGNPINMTDPEGKDFIIRGAEDTSVMIFTSAINQDWDLSSTGIDFKGNYYFDGLKSATDFFDMLGIADPSFVCDGISTALYLYQGKVGDALLSAIAIVPCIGDITKIKHIDEYVDLFKVVYHNHHIIPKAVYKRMEDLWTVMEKNNRTIKVPAGFHGNHPKYSKWIENELNDIIKNEGKLTPDSVNKLIQKSTKEINNALLHYQITGENMNKYFERLLHY
jgi:RHS repeat-associated protein